ncbi:stalk domain-containing protein [Paenibacillus sp. 1P07SE]|uniref:stalk domain-containing protein n=1 Tax=Paenibacillus sp. 1P07SE TaxID=3132209 RepID=UPI0039A4675C
MKKLVSACLAFILIISLLPQSGAQAATGTTIYINGDRLVTDQQPVITGGRILLPLRAVFEGLHAIVDYDSPTKTITASQSGTTIILRVGSRTASVNGQNVTLDVPAQVVGGRTLVPLRFVSESIGAQVDWQTGQVFITTVQAPVAVNAVTGLQAAVTGSQGDGRDVTVSFRASSGESAVSHYRVFAVKSGKASGFTTAAALSVSSRQYTTLLPTGRDQSLTFTAQSRDTDGEVLRADQPYVIFVLTVGQSNGQHALSGASPAFTLTASNTLPAVTNVRVSDIGDSNDGRDLRVTFNKLADETRLNHYRVYVVKSGNASSFNLQRALNVTAGNYTVVYRTGSNLSQTLESGARDVDGALLRNGNSYRVFVMAVGQTANSLSAASDAITLSQNLSLGAATNVAAFDVSDFGDGRDLRVTFNRVADESTIAQYRIIVVKSSKSDAFNLTAATNVSSRNYTAVSKTGAHINQLLASGARDTDGDLIRTGVGYRVFVLSVGTSAYSGSNTLSAASGVVTLVNNFGTQPAFNVGVADVSDFGDGRDLFVSFSRPGDESLINQYRIMVVPATNANAFNLAAANNVSSRNYTAVSKTGGNISQTLTSSARDVNGNLIRGGISYRVFILSVSQGGSGSSNALSAASNAITLSTNYSVPAVTNVTASDVNDFGDGRDLLVSFNRATDESQIGQYRVYVVKSANASRFTLATAVGVASSNYTTVSKTGAHISQTLAAGTRDVDGAPIQNGIEYRIFVLSVGSGASNGTNTLSSASGVIQLSNSSAQPVTGVTASDVSDFGDGRDLQVSFNRASDETRVRDYRILVVKSANASSFNLTAANAVASSNYTVIGKTGSNISQTLSAGARDTDGAPIQNGVAYKVFVLSVGTGSLTNALSTGSADLTLGSPVLPASGVVATVVQNGDKTELQVSFATALNESNISSYAVIAAPAGAPFDLAAANRAVSEGWYIQLQRGAGTRSTSLFASDRDSTGANLTAGGAYRIYVLSLPQSGGAGVLSDPSAEVRF